MDKYAVEKIRKQFDFTKDGDILKLYEMVQSGQLVLDGEEGRALDDEIYELAMAARKRQREGVSHAGDGGRGAAKKTRAGAAGAGGGKTQLSESGKKRGKKDRRRVVVLTRKEMRIRRLFIVLFAVIALVCFVYFGLYCYDAYLIRRDNQRMAALKQNETVNSMYTEQKVEYEDEETGEQKQLVVLDEYKSLYNRNKNLIGWLKIADTNIDYPVMQTNDNTYYLDHDIAQNPDKNGTLFMDAACDVARPSTNLIIYGHNMRSGNMFGSLGKYKSPEYYKKHPTIDFDSIYEKGEYQVMYAFNSHIYGEAEIAFKYYQFIDAATEQEFDSNMRAMAEMSLYDTGVEAVYGDQLLTLSTCDYEEKNGRFVVVAKRIQ